MSVGDFLQRMKITRPIEAPVPRPPSSASNGSRPSPPHAGPSGGAPVSHAPGPARPAVSQSELAQRREALANEFVEQQWDLGGMVYEMASRDHFRLDVLVRHSAKLQQLDAELAEVERMLRLEQAGAAGNCPSCGALYARGAVYCWQCGTDLMPRGPVGGATAA